MKHIHKDPEPLQLAQWKAKKTSTQRVYANLKKNTSVKNAIKRAMLTEQGYICCYCEQRISSDTSHIEHLIPRGSPQTRSNRAFEVDYGNMLCSCQREVHKNTVKRCGQARGNWHPNDYVSPLDPMCETRFTYYESGKIKPTKPNDSTATTMISLLGLDQHKESRKRVIDELYDLEPSEIALILEKDATGMFHEYHSAIKQVFS